METAIKSIFKNKEEVISLAKNCELYSEARRLKNLIRQNSEVRDPNYLSLPELNEILAFKLRSQFGRQKKIRAQNEEQVIRRITELALNIDTGYEEYNDEIRTKILCCLKGIGIPIASAILALTYPEKYAIIDRRNWRLLYSDKAKTNFMISDYLRYLKVVRELSRRFEVFPQTVDMALWEKEQRV